MSVQGVPSKKINLPDGTTINLDVRDDLPESVVMALINPATGSGTALMQDGTFVDVKLEGDDG